MPLSEYKQRLRDRVGHAVLLSVGVTAFVQDDAGRVLLQRRGDTGLWGLPGGEVEPLEFLADAVVRETWEETGLIVEPVRVMAVLGGPEFHITYPNGDQNAVIDIVFDCRITGGSLRPDGDETLELAFVSLEDGLRMLDLPPDLKARIASVLEASGPAYFDPPDWTPPAHGHRENGISPYMRSLRDKIGHEVVMMAGAAALIFDEQGRILLQRRGDTGDWGITGGAIDPDEAPANAARREAWEETGLLVEPVRITGIYGGPEYHVVYPNKDAVAIVSITFACRVTGGTLSADGKESLELHYFDPEEALRTLEMPPRTNRRIRDALRPSAATLFDPPTQPPPA